MNAPELIIKPIGIIRTAMSVKFDAPPQPSNLYGADGVIELHPNLGFEESLRDLDGFDRIWLIWWFHRNNNWRPLVLPPRGNSKRRGVFATRSPHRPNPVGMTSVPLLKIDGLKLFVGNNDLVDGTPILDIKPYISEVDSFPDAKNGWIGEVEVELSGPPTYEVTFSELATNQRNWLIEEFQIEFLERAISILQRDPKPHRTRRISRCKTMELSDKKQIFKMGCGAWRLFFSLNNKEVHIESIEPGYPIRLLEMQGYENVPHRDAQIKFLSRWRV